MSEKLRIEAIEARLKELEHELGIQKDIEEIRRLHYIYMYYNSNRMAKQLLDLVSSLSRGRSNAFSLYQSCNRGNGPGNNRPHPLLDR